MTSDPAAALASDPRVEEVSQSARSAIDTLLWNRKARGMGEALATESTLAGAWCSSAFEGAEVILADLRQGIVEDSPMGRVAARTLNLYAKVPELGELFLTSPLQALAQMHTLVADRATDGTDVVGRPRANDDPSDPLRLGTTAAVTDLGPRLAGLRDLVTSDTQAPAIVLAGLVHAEVAVMQPFSSGSGLVARALTRMVLRGKAVDPDGWSFPEVGLRRLGRPAYVKALRAYASGTPAGVADWLVHHGNAVQIGAQEAETWVAAQD